MKQNYTINVKDYFTTIGTDEYNKDFAKVYLEENFCELGFTIEAIIQTCIKALETEKADVFQVTRVLNVAVSLIPHSELEALQEIYNQKKAQTKI